MIDEKRKVFFVFSSFTHDAKFGRNGLVSADTFVPNFMNRSINNNINNFSYFLRFQRRSNWKKRVATRFICPRRRICTEISRTIFVAPGGYI
jgi:hypothetical protein